jgi:site-specific DNA-methyltransferase (adenine-specific)
MTDLLVFFNTLLKAPNIKTILDTYDTPSKKGIVFEQIAKLLTYFGCISKFPRDEFTYLTGNMNNANLKILSSIQRYLTNSKINTSNASGYSDIIIQNKEDLTYTFITCKYILEPTRVSQYDTQNIDSAAILNKHIYTKYNIMFIIQNKQVLLNLAKTANKSSLNITRYITPENIIDEIDLNVALKSFQKCLKNLDFNNYDNTFNSLKLNLTMRMHQEVSVLKIIKLIKSKINKILIGFKPRSGKTYTIGYLIYLMSLNQLNFNAFILTPAPNETITQFTEELFYKFNNFNLFQVIHLTSLNILNLQELLNKSKFNIIIASKQFMQNYINNFTLVAIKQLNLDLIIFDENHFSGTTELSQTIFTSYASKITTKSTTSIYLTATYNKTLNAYNIVPEAQLYWTLEDEMLCKQHNVKQLIENHDNLTFKEFNNYFLKNKNVTQVFSSYQNMPELHILTIMFDSQRYDNIKEKIQASQYGFSYTSLFSFKTVSATRFQFKREVSLFLRYLSGSQKEVDFKDGDKSILTRINDLITLKNSRPAFTMLFFLPPDNIDKTSLCLKEVMLEDDIFKNYDILIINSNQVFIIKDIKENIRQAEIKAKLNKKFGLIILAGSMLNLGITLENCDVVMLFHDSLSSDKISQQLNRCMTESKNKSTIESTNKSTIESKNKSTIESKNKKIGIIIDLHIGRVINNLINYKILNKNLNIEQKLSYITTNHLINIDADMFTLKELNANILINKMLELWKNDPSNSYKNLILNLDTDYVEFNNTLQDKINKYFIQGVDKKITTYIEFTDNSEEYLQEIQSGKEIKVIKVIKEDNKVDNKVIKKVEIIEVSFTKEVLPFIIPLVCLLTIKDKNKDFLQMLASIQEDKNLLDIFDDQTLIWWNSTKLINFIKNIITKYFDKNSNIFNISIQFKMALISLIDEPKKLLELIEDCLKPKTVEKKKFGEVFTPMFIVNEMLDQLPKEVWLNKDLKWLDPAAGMGNFSVAIYLRLMESLTIIKDETIRKKHILENMLYAIELNKKNVFIYNQIFDINNNYKLNLHEGDSLKVDLVKTFKVKHFDIILGNPPYNKAIINKSGASPIYNEFIEKYIDKCNYLTFIIPSRWMSGGKGLDKFRQMMLTRTDIKLINHFNDAGVIFKNNVNIEGGVSYFLKDNTYKSNQTMFNNKLIQLNKYDILVDSLFYTLINKLVTYESINTLYLGRYYSIESNDKRLVDTNIKNKLIKCYVSKQKGFIKYIDAKCITRDYDFYKVITARANGAYKCFGNTFIGLKPEVHTGSYISFKVNTKLEAESLISYMKCKLPNVMLSLRKISQDISESTCLWIPSITLNKIWTDDLVYAYFNLTTEDITLIKNIKLSGYKDVKKEVVKKVDVGEVDVDVDEEEDEEEDEDVDEEEVEKDEEDVDEEEVEKDDEDVDEEEVEKDDEDVDGYEKLEEEDEKLEKEEKNKDKPKLKSKINNTIVYGCFGGNKNAVSYLCETDLKKETREQLKMKIIKEYFEKLKTKN